MYIFYTMNNVLLLIIKISNLVMIYQIYHSDDISSLSLNLIGIDSPVENGMII